MRLRLYAPVVAVLSTAAAEYQDPALHHTVVVTVTASDCPIDAQSSTYPVVNVGGQATFAPVTTVTWTPPVFEPTTSLPADPWAAPPNSEQQAPGDPHTNVDTAPAPLPAVSTVDPAPAAPTPAAPTLTADPVDPAIPASSTIATTLPSDEIPDSPATPTQTAESDPAYSPDYPDVEPDSTVTVWSTAPTPEVWITVYEDPSTTISQWTTYTQTFTAVNTTYTQTFTVPATTAIANTSSSFEWSSLAPSSTPADERNYTAPRYNLSGEYVNGTSSAVTTTALPSTSLSSASVYSASTSSVLSSASVPSSAVSSVSSVSSSVSSVSSSVSSVASSVSTVIASTTSVPTDAPADRYQNAAAEEAPGSTLTVSSASSSAPSSYWTVSSEPSTSSAMPTMPPTTTTPVTLSSSTSELDSTTTITSTITRTTTTGVLSATPNPLISSVDALAASAQGLSTKTTSVALPA